ncbi:MAG: ArsC/Spx/MgsR family protein [Bacteroidota bacterium]
MKKVFFLKTCTTCNRIIKELGNLLKDFEFQEIKSEPLNRQDLDEMHSRSKNFESLFSRKARKYRELNLSEKELKEADYEALLLEDYTFLKRPVFIIEKEIFIGNSAKEIERLKSYLDKSA